MRLLSFCLLLALPLIIACTNGGNDDSDVSVDNDACGTVGLASKIFNGTQCAASPSPLVEVLASRGSARFTCSGTLLTPRHVLTAAHCFNETADSVTVRGSLRSQTSSVSSVVIHPDFTEVNGLLVNDAAILLLDSPVASPSLPLFASHTLREGETISIFGYGLDETGKGGLLKSGEMELADVREDVFIAEFGDEGSNTCFGDSGGPALVTAQRDDGATVTGIVGITSGGTNETCTKGDRSSFTNIQSSNVLDFIRDVVPSVRIE